MDLGCSDPDRVPGGLAIGDRIAALDLGTNNCRLLVAEVEEAGCRVVDSFSRIVRLGEGLAASGRLSEAAMARTLAALKVCARIIARNRVRLARCVATEACRRAVNGADFVRRVARATGLGLEVLDHEEEARLAMLGCLPLVNPAAAACLMVDIGGGSTELYALQLATLSETHGREIDAAGYARTVEQVRAALDRLATPPPPLGAGRAVQLIGTSGTVTTLAAVHLGLRRYDRRKVDGVELPFAAIAAVSRRLLALDHAARAAHPCIGSGRADLVLAGCAILDAVHERWPVERLTVADRGVREGILGMLVGGVSPAMAGAAAA
jgi:exopolyphosphatase/guanosine-5'-triphosphate,3'-diphosphate pyrophosphatase